MTRAMKLVALVGALAVLTVGPGCGVFDEFYDDFEEYTASYPREQATSPVQSAGARQPAEVSNNSAPTQPGIYPSSDKR